MSDSKVSEPAFLARDGWRHADKWRRDGGSFLVEVSRHSVGTENRWCVYLYVYPKHPDFARFNPAGGMWDQPSYDCHSYVSYFRAHRNNEGEISSFQLGWDYQHDGDSDYAELATEDDAGSVFWDASQLFDSAMASAAAPAANGETE